MEFFERQPETTLQEKRDKRQRIQAFEAKMQERGYTPAEIKTVAESEKFARQGEMKTVYFNEENSLYKTDQEGIEVSQRYRDVVNFIKENQEVFDEWNEEPDSLLEERAQEMEEAGMTPDFVAPTSPETEKEIVLSLIDQKGLTLDFLLAVNQWSEEVYKKAEIPMRFPDHKFERKFKTFIKNMQGDDAMLIESLARDVADFIPIYVADKIGESENEFIKALKLLRNPVVRKLITDMENE